MLRAMYAAFFGLQQEAFSIAPDPRFLYLSAQHREALAHLLFGLTGGGGFVLLTGEIGAGKTTVCRAFLEQVGERHRVAYLYNPKLSVSELLHTVCQEFGITVDADASVKTLVDALNRFLLAEHAAGRDCLLVIDEAQALSGEVLEQLRLLTNLETAERKLLQIVLIGQPELRAMLARADLEQLAQRVIARVHLGALSAGETADYVRHRLAVAGWHGELPFEASALGFVRRASGGVPRRINLVCQRAMLGAYARGQRRIDRATVVQAAREVFGDARGGGIGVWRSRRVVAAVAALGIAGIAAAVAALWQTSHPGPPPAPAVALAGAVSGAVPAVIAGAASDAAAAPAAALPDVIDEEARAWQVLAATWAVDLGSTDPCTTARTKGLACHIGTADRALLRKLDRPALLQLEGGGWLVLRGLSDTAARVLGADGHERVVTLAAIDAQWRGRYRTLWRTPKGWPGDSSAGEEVLARLTELQGPARPAATRDETLRRRVFAFQVAQGLEVDGLAGPVTLMQLNRAAGVDEPRLAEVR